MFDKTSEVFLLQKLEKSAELEWTLTLFYCFRMGTQLLVEVLEVFKHYPCDFLWQCMPSRFHNSSLHSSCKCHSPRCISVFLTLCYCTETDLRHTFGAHIFKEQCEIMVFYSPLFKPESGCWQIFGGLIDLF